MTVRVEYLDEEPSGLASMLGGLVEANLEAHPEREALLKPSVVGLIAEDSAVAVTLRLAPGRVTVANGLVGGTHDLVIRTSSEDLIALTAVPLRLGLPDPMTADGRRVMGSLIRGRLRVKGMFLRLPTLTRVQRLLSVA